MGAIIKEIADFLDLSKRIAVTIPGMVLALGLILIFGSPPDVFQKAKLTRDRNEYDGKIRAAQRTLHALELASQSAPANDQQAKANAQDDVEAQKNAIAALKAERSDLEERLKKVSDFDRLIPASINSILLFGLLGFAIGSVLDPVNKAIFLQLLPRTKGKFASIISGHNLLTKASRGVMPPSIGEQPLARPEEARDAATPRTAAQLAAAAPAQFYIGRGLITQAEYDGFIADYYRFSEVSIGMILPTLIVAMGLANTYHAWLALPFGLFLAVLFYRTGISRYGEFRFQVFSFIAGREAAQLKQEALMARQSIVAKLVAVIEDLENRAKSFQEVELRYREAAGKLLDGEGHRDE